MGETVAGGAGDLDVGPWIAAGNAPLRSMVGGCKLICANLPLVIVSRLGEAGQCHTPTLLASAPAWDGAGSGIRDGGDDADAAEPLAQAMLSVEIRRSGPIGTFRSYRNRD